MKPGDNGWDYCLERYLYAQNYITSSEIRAKYKHQGPTQYDRALQELTDGKKESHWMWFIFPQIKGLGMSTWDQTYSIKSLTEAKNYLMHNILCTRLITCTEALVNLDKSIPKEIFEYPDDLKLRSCMTLFEIAGYGKYDVFEKVINKYYYGERDIRTIQILDEMKL
jgi:uncharacterized protein (DUF1810 family)